MGSKPLHKLSPSVLVKLFVPGLLLCGSVLADTAAPTFPGLADPGQPTSLSIQAGSTDPSQADALLRGPDARMQLVVTAKYSTGQSRDWTRQVHYSSEPSGIVQLDELGSLVPLADGKVTVTAKSDAGLTAQTQITVSDFKSPAPINFPNQIVPIFTKLGCNSGGCHGKAAGQNGFRLSLLGFDPHKDYQYLVEESRGRRVFPAAPAQSLLLLKPTNTLAHGGGERLKPDSHEYHLIYRWISQGMPYGRSTDPTLTSISVFPQSGLYPREGHQQLMVIAHYSDGSSEDVSQSAQYDANDKEMAEVSDGGYAQMLGRPGDVAVMARYQGQVAVFHATVPVGAAISELPKPRNFIDELAFEKFKSLGLPPSPLCDDATFLRRVTLDITGQIPTEDQAKGFIADTDPTKRDKCIDRLLASNAYADYFSQKWSAILRNRRERPTFTRGDYLFYQWIHESIQSNKPYDRFVADLLTASGDESVCPPVVWYRQSDDASKQVEDTAQLFLGVRIQCAHCHHHPFEKWSQHDYYSLAAFFSKVDRKEGAEQGEFRVVMRRGEAQMENPASRTSEKPAPLGAKPQELSPDQDPRLALVSWMTARDNPFFAKSLTNRYWKHFFGRGLVDPEDDMRATNPPSNPQLLDALAQHFIEHNFDMKDLIRTICQSDLYQLSSEPNESNARDAQSFSHHYPQRLNAEVLLDAINQLNGTHENFAGVSTGARAVQLPDMNGVDSYFLQVFGRPAGASSCECERTNATSLAQSLQLLNSNELYDKLDQGIAAKLVSPDDKRTDQEKVTSLYFAAYSRAPTNKELDDAIAYLHRPQVKEPKDKQAALEDLLWVMLNTKEFLFNH